MKHRGLIFPAILIVALFAAGCGGRLFGPGVHSSGDAEKYMTEHVLLGLNTRVRCEPASSGWAYACEYTDRRWVAITGTTHVKVGLAVSRSHVSGVSGVVAASDPLPPPFTNMDDLKSSQR